MHMNIPDAPDIAETMRTGYPNGYRVPVCPICGQECTIVYKDASREIVGCDECLLACEADGEEDCYPFWDV